MLMAQSQISRGAVFAENAADHNREIGRTISWAHRAHRLRIAVRFMRVGKNLSNR